MAKHEIAPLLISVLLLGSVVGMPALAAVQLSGSATGGPTTTGGTVQVSFTITNNGDEGTNAAVLAITSIPAGWSVQSHSDDGRWNPDTQEFLYFGGLGAGSSVTSTLTLSVPSDAAEGDYTVSADVKDSENTVVDSVNATVTLRNQLELSSDDGKGEPGGTAVVSFTATNNGDTPVDAILLNITDYPAGWNIESTGGDGTFQSSNQEIVYVTIEAGSSATSTVEFDIPESATNGTYSVSAALLTDQGSANVSTATASIRVFSSVTDRYDQNGNGDIDTEEVLDAIHDWETAGLTTTEVLQLIDEWASD